MFEWFFGNKTPEKKEIPNEERENSLHGFDLDKWEYLGYSQIRILDRKTAAVMDSGNVFFFIEKSDHSNRKYVIKADKNSSVRTHPWIQTHADLWKIEEKEHYEVVLNEPSSWLEDHMMEQYQHSWNGDGWVPSSEEVRYQKAVLDQQEKTVKEKIISEEVKEECKIITVEFGNKKVDTK